LPLARMKSRGWSCPMTIWLREEMYDHVAPRS
jgi:hypothetical protein